jgi:hypothetical protein
MVYGQKGIALMVSVALANAAFHRLLKQVIQRGRRRGETGDVLIFTRPAPSPPRRTLFPWSYVKDFDEPRTQLGAWFGSLARRMPCWRT